MIVEPYIFLASFKGDHEGDLPTFSCSILSVPCR